MMSKLSFRKQLKCLCSVAVAGCLTACGGGGSSPPPETEAPPPPVAAPPTTPGVQASGAVLLQASNADDYGDAVMLELESGEQRLLPRSDIATAHTEKVDAWYASTFPESTADLVRVDDLGNVDFFDRDTGTRTGGFSIDSLAGTDLPEIYGPVKPSPDGRYLLTYFKANYRQDNPVITVFDRDGNVVESGSQFSYDRYDHRSALDWLPDGRYVYLAGPKIVVTTIGGDTLQVADLVLPPNASTEGATLRIGPDGLRMLMSVPVVLPDAGGVEMNYSLLYTANIDGGDLRQLTALTDEVQAEGGRLYHSNATWSPDGEMVAFVVQESDAHGAPFFRNGCPYVLVVPSDGEQIEIDGFNDPESYKMFTTGAAASAHEALRACSSVSMSWMND